MGSWNVVLWPQPTKVTILPVMCRLLSGFDQGTGTNKYPESARTEASATPAHAGPQACGRLPNGRAVMTNNAGQTEGVITLGPTVITETFIASTVITRRQPFRPF